MARSIRIKKVAGIDSSSDLTLYISTKRDTFLARAGLIKGRKTKAYTKLTFSRKKAFKIPAADALIIRRSTEADGGFLLFSISGSGTGASAVQSRFSASGTLLTTSSLAASQLVGLESDLQADLNRDGAIGSTTPPGDSTPPAPPSTPDLLASSDSGSSDADNVTADNTPTITGTAEPGSRIEIRNGTSLIGTTAATADGLWIFTVPEASAFTDGSYSLTALAIDAAGNASLPSAPLQLTIQPDPTSTPLTVALAASSDTGVPGDGLTALRLVGLNGTAQAGSRIALRNTTTTTLAGAGGAFFLPNVLLNNGENLLTIEQLDDAGNVLDSKQLRLSLAIPTDPGAVDADPVLAWNRIALEAIRNDASLPAIATRALAMVSIAVLDTLAAIDRTPAFLVGLSAPDGIPAAAAAAAAAERVLRYLFPAQQDAFTSRLNDDLAAVAAGAPRDQALEFGRAIAEAVIALREQDGWDRFVTATEGQAPGEWRPTPPMFDVGQSPQWEQLAPFSLLSGDQFRPAPPPALASAAYSAALEEVQRLGSATSSERSAEQTQIARFWADGIGSYTPPGHWNEIASSLAAAEGYGLGSAARLLAILNVTLADASIAAWDSKYSYNFWRPITAIRSAADDGNPETTADPSWQPLLITPPHPEYVSGHSTYSGAAASVLASLLGDQSFSTGSISLPGVNRSYSSFQQAAQEAGRSRIFGGIHYEFSNQAGQQLGREVAEWVLDAFRSDVDLRGPHLVLDQPPGQVFQKTPLFNGFALDNLSGVARLSMFLDGEDQQQLIVDERGRFTLDAQTIFGDLADGSHSLMLIAEDGSGNLSETLIREFTIDSKPPTIVVEEASNGGELTAWRRLRGIADGTGSQLKSLTYRWGTGVQRPVAVDPLTGSFDVPLELGSLPPGPQELELVALDAAGLSQTETLRFNLSDAIPLTVTGFNPADGARDIGSTFQPEVRFSRPVDPASVTADAFNATDTAGNKLPATIVVSPDGTRAWLLFQQAMPGSNRITLRLNGDLIRAAADGQLLDADGDGAPGGQRQSAFTTVNLTAVPGTSLSGFVVGPGADLKPMSYDDFRAGPDGAAHTDDDVFLERLAGVKVFILGLEDQAVYTDTQGRFELKDIPTGNIKVAIDGRTSTSAPAGSFYPEMVMDLTIRPGQVNTVMGSMGASVEQEENNRRGEVYLPRIASAVLTTIAADRPTTVTPPEEGAVNLTAEQRGLIQLLVRPGSAIGKDGKPLSEAQIGIATVPPELVRDMLPPGLLQHTFDLTIQAPGAAVFANPLQLTLPNVFNAAPGTQLNLLSFDHNTGRLVIDGTGTVSQDGRFVVTNPGSGVTRPGWHGLTPPGTELSGGEDDPCGGSGSDDVVQPKSMEQPEADEMKFTSVKSFDLTPNPRPAPPPPPPILVLRSACDPLKPPKPDPCKNTFDKERIAFAIRNAVASAQSCAAVLSGNIIIAVRLALLVDPLVKSAYDLYKTTIALDKLLRDKTPAIDRAQKIVEIAKTCIGLKENFKKLQKNFINALAPLKKDFESKFDCILNAVKSLNEAAKSANLECNPELKEKLAYATRFLDYAILLAEKVKAEITGKEDKVKDAINKAQLELLDDLLRKVKSTYLSELGTTDPDFTPSVMNAQSFEPLVTARFDATNAASSIISAISPLDADFSELGTFLDGFQDAITALSGDELTSIATDKTLISDIKYTSSILSQLSSSIYRSLSDDYKPINAPFAIFLEDSTIRGTTGGDGSFNAFIPSDQLYEMRIVNIPGRKLGSLSGISAASGQKTEIPTLLYLDWSSLPDSDADGIPDQAEEVIGTLSSVKDTDRDGIEDLAELLAGSNPLGKTALQTGILNILNLPGLASDLELISRDPMQPLQAAIALGREGIALVDLSNPTKPVLITQLALPFEALSVAYDNSRQSITVSGKDRFAVIDVTDLSTPKILRTIRTKTDWLVVDSGVSFSISDRTLSLYDLDLGEKLKDIDFGVSLVGLSVDADFVYLTAADNTLRILKRTGQARLDIEPASRLDLPFAVTENSQPVLGQGILYLPLEEFNGGYATIDLQDPLQPRLISGVDDPAIAGRAMAFAGPDISLNVGSPGGTSSLDVISIKDPNKTDALVTRFNLPASPWDIDYADGLAYALTNQSLITLNPLQRNLDTTAPSIDLDLQRLDEDPGKQGIQIQQGTNLTLRPQIAESNSLQTVELILNGQPVAVDRTFPYSFNLNLPPISPEGGNLATLKVRAVDNSGNTGESATLTLELTPDVTPPRLLGSTIKSGDRVQQFLNSIKLSFSESVSLDGDPNTIFRLSSSGISKPILDAKLRSDYTVLITFDPLPPGEYQLQIDGSRILDDAGLPLQDDPIETRFTVTPKLDIDLANIAKGIGGFAIRGAGRRAIGLGDINGDGLADFAVDQYVIFGKKSTDPVDTSSLEADQTGFEIEPRYLSATGDINSDGLSDVLAGGFGSGGGFVGGFVVYGKTSSDPTRFEDLAVGATEGYAILGVDFNADTTSFHEIGDLNGDGASDFALENRQTVYVLYGPLGTNSFDVSERLPGAGGFILRTGWPGNYKRRFPLSISNAGDVNGDGITDLAIGLPDADPGSREDAGRVLIVFGRSDFAESIEVEDIINGQGGFAINGINVGNRYGYTVKSLPDLNQDGKAEIIIGSSSNTAYVVFGKESGTPVELSEVSDGNGGFAIKGESSGLWTSMSVDSAVDLNGDQRNDFIIGDRGADTITGLESGRSYVIFGPTDLKDIDLSDLQASKRGIFINGETMGDHSGHSISGLGDVNGDGHPDLLIAAMDSVAFNTHQAIGSAYVIFGGPESLFDIMT